MSASIIGSVVAVELLQRICPAQLIGFVAAPQMHRLDPVKSATDLRLISPTNDAEFGPAQRRIQQAKGRTDMHSCIVNPSTFDQVTGALLLLDQRVAGLL